MSDSTHSTKTGVTVFTWGSQDNSPLKSQYLPEVVNHFYQIKCRSHNTGHAALLVTLLDTPENRSTVLNELTGTSIPYQFKNYQTKALNYAGISLNDGAISDFYESSHTIFSESVIEVYFSFWPVKNTAIPDYQAPSVLATYDQDIREERRGVPVSVNNNKLLQLNPELKPENSPRKIRPIRNLFRPIQDEITLGFNSIYHPVGDNLALNTLVTIYQQNQLIARRIESIGIMQKKIRCFSGCVFFIRSEEIQKDTSLVSENELYLQENGDYITKYKEKLYTDSLIKGKHSNPSIDLSDLPNKISDLNFKNTVLTILSNRKHAYYVDLRNQEIQQILLPSIFKNQLLQYMSNHITETSSNLLKNEKISLIQLDILSTNLTAITTYLKSESEWDNLRLVKALYSYVVSTTVTTEQKRTIEKKRILNKITYSTKEEYLDYAELNRDIAQYNQIEQNEKLTAVSCSSDVFALSNTIEQLLLHIYTNSINQDIMLKIIDFLTSGYDRNFSEEKINSTNNQYEQFLHLILETRDLYMGNHPLSKKPQEAHQELLAYIKTIKEIDLECLSNNYRLDSSLKLLSENNNFDKTITATAFTKIFEALMIPLSDISLKAKNINNNDINQLTNQSYFVGKQPDHSLFVPLKNASREGLDPFSMLKEMATIVKEQRKFDTFSYNCSHTTMQVIKAGAGNKGWLFEPGAFSTLFTFTPHVVYMTTRKYLTTLNDPVYCQTPSPYFCKYQSYLNSFGNSAVKNASEIMNDPSFNKKPIKHKAKTYAKTLGAGAVAAGLELTGALTFSLPFSLKNTAYKAIRSIKRKLEFDYEEPKAKRRRTENKT